MRRTLIPIVLSALATTVTVSADASLPEGTVVAIEISGLSSRWAELRAARPIARLQDRLLEAVGLGADDVPGIAADRAILALVSGEGRASCVPLMVLRPVDPAAAERRLASIREVGVRRRGETLWVAPPERIDGLMARRTAPFPLPGTGLARGRVDPEAASALLRSIAGETMPPLAFGAALVAAEAELLRDAVFQREFDSGEIRTVATFDYHADRLPEAIRRFFADPFPPPRLPSTWPAGVVAMKSFRVDGGAWLAWLRHAGASDGEGPLRNLEFWIDEIEGRTKIDIDRTLRETLGRRGWFVAFDAEEPPGVRAVVVLEVADGNALETALLEYRSWLSEHIWGRSLGLTVPRNRDVTIEGRSSHGLSLASPFGVTTTPVFLISDRHLFVGTDSEAARDGLRLFAGEPAWEIPRLEGLSGEAPDEIALVRGSSLARIAAAWTRRGGTEGLYRLFADALDEIGPGLGTVEIGVRYRPEGVQIRSRVPILD